MVKKISGSWIEFKHANFAEGKYWNEECAKFTCKQWEEKIKEQAEIGMEYLVLMSSALNGKAYFKTDILPIEKIGCDNPMETLLSAADKFNIKFFVSNGFFLQWDEIDKYNSSEIVKRHLKAMNQIAEQFSHHKSFYGWYFPIEAFINGHFQDEYIDNVNKQSKEASIITPAAKKLIAPFGTRVCANDEKYLRQLDELDVDFIAYQDEVGVQKTRVDELTKIYENLRKSHDKIGKSALWADVEIFEFEGEVYKSALIPAEFERVEKQLQAVSPFVDVILVYQYLGIMNKPGTSAFTGHKNSTKLYCDYLKWQADKIRK